jgi:glycosyltransferase involved in cell wall biosynthesis
MPYPIEVHHRIRRDERLDYAHTARALTDCVDVVSIQHEFGIWGGDDGAYVLDFARALRVPMITTLHAVLRTPTEGQRAVLSELLAISDTTVVMSRSAAALVTTAYGVDPYRIAIVPHGVPDLPLVDPETVKPRLGVEGRLVILSFGLLGPRKGLDEAIEAMPAVVAAHPTALYVIVGATHPEVRDRDGEAHRTSLVERVARLGLKDHVLLVDRFVGRVELTRWLEAADVFLTPYADADQMVSGTLSYAMGAGRAIVSTPFAAAAELLADGRGVLVPPGSPARLASALNRLLAAPAERAELGRLAYEHSRTMVWSAVGAEYGRLFARLAGSPIRAAPLLLAAVGA